MVSFYTKNALEGSEIVTEYEKRDHLAAIITFLFSYYKKEAQSELSNVLFSVIN